MKTFKTFLAELSDHKSEKDRPEDGHSEMVASAVERSSHLEHYYKGKARYRSSMKVLDEPNKKVTHITRIGDHADAPTKLAVVSEKNKHGKWDHRMNEHHPSGKITTIQKNNNSIN